MQCIHEKETSKFGESCKRGHKFCMEDRCPDYQPVTFGEEEDA
jgi:hypothetical protein